MKLIVNAKSKKAQFLSRIFFISNCFKANIIEILDAILLVFSGLVGGFLAGLLGIGGSPIYVIIFSSFIPKLYGEQLSESETVHFVIANTIFARTFASLAGCWKHYQMNNWYPKIILLIGIPATIVSLITLYCLSKINYSKIAFSITFIVMLLPLLYKMVTDDKNKKSFNQPHRIKTGYLYVVGVVTGVISALSGLGGGFVLIPILNGFFNVKIRKVTAISLGVILFMSIFMCLLYLFLLTPSTSIPYTYGAISLSLAIPVMIGVLLGAPFGVLVSKKLQPFTIRLIFILFCSIIILQTLIDLICACFITT